MILFEGEYTFEDRIVTFSGDGRISGLDSIKYYSVAYDYIGPGYGELDIIFLGKTKHPQAMSCFEFNADTLFIYNVRCVDQDADGICLDLQKAALRYKLVANRR